MSPATFAVRLDKGAHASWSFPVTARQGSQRVPVDLTGASAVAELRKDTGQPVLVRLESDATNPGQASIQFQGSTIVLLFKPNDTAGATWDTAELDILLTLANGMRSRTTRVAVTLNHGITEA